MSAALFAKVKELEVRVRALEESNKAQAEIIKELQAQRPTLKLPEKPKAA